ncbi:hypothetical protein ONZ43_g4804 [Nemania bipapillata]|uniref:Uncharacterized protein n=1 Tax=Nemania bipapillata TaxID=110536 RepID=A0ACC2IIE5_9PEZI|nr:hypothetical protein ONZ43_g4804 [Nemania bipapillata]
MGRLLQGVLSKVEINYQDVRCHGPLFDPMKSKLEDDPDKAKKQWRNLCVAYRLKQEVTYALWEKNRELEAQSKRMLDVVRRLDKDLARHQEVLEQNYDIISNCIYMMNEMEIERLATKQVEGNHSAQEEEEQDMVGTH